MDADLNHVKATAISLVFTLVITLTAATFGDYHSSDKILLSDVKALTLHQGRMTNSRRSSPVPQLKCVGGSAQYKFTPKTVQCINRGSDGYDIQWECKTDMDNAYRFGHVEVTCEGYNYPNDPYILKGSCGLEYTVELTEEGRQKESYRGGSPYSYTYKSEGGISGLFVFIGILLVMYIIYKLCLAPNVVTHGEQPPPYGFRQEYMPSQGPPPPYDGYSSASFGFGNTYPKPGYPHASATNGGGFWTGAATGGLLGYLFGRGNNYNTGWGTGTWGGNGFNHPTSSSGAFFSSSSGSPSSSGSRMTSGFGGTTRR
ncbi:store-operated calcium entry-associated regulatory factor [Biomphalaria pfeifferi]|uniref:Store-operated calcium entry-associated regulatory factor n=1 Tax=Biomphalaria pfeifferi TaxID=112525 RepID=A0AAD8AQP7_BIOPF|nr:store-operated calcium entry-associated regulatory factor [Biomphalaria pfeifferi]